MSQEIDAALERIGERISRREHGHHPNKKSARAWTRKYVTDELAMLRALLVAAQEAARPSIHSFVGDAARDYYERREALRQALADFLKEPSNG